MTAKQQIKEYSTTEAALAALRKDYENVIFDMTKSKGLPLAKKARRSIITLRTDLEKARKRLKAPILERGKLLDSEAKRITAELVALEAPIDEQIKVEEARIEAEKERARLAEEARIEAIKARITTLREAAHFATPPSVQEAQDAHDALIEEAIDETYEELQEDAHTAHVETLARLRTEIRLAKEREAEAAQVAADRAELKKLRKEKEKREKEEADKRVEEIVETGSQTVPLEPEPKPFTELKSMPPSKTYPGTQAIINCVAIQFDVSLPLAEEWVCRARHELAEEAAS